ncbi:MAG: hypothetical protein VX699_04845 [Myxococcota bacterium]|nr:hypothetical protein [Myxococcota bacterium]
MLPYLIAVALSLSMAPDTATKAPLIPNAVAVEDAGRFTSPRNFDDTIKYYRRYFRAKGGVRWHHIVNQPTVKAKHIQSLRKSTLWEGINIYEKKGEVRIYIIPRKTEKTELEQQVNNAIRD